MIRLVMLAVLLVCGLWVYQRIMKTPPAQRGAIYWQLGLGALALILVGLALTGRVHWVGAIIGAALPFLRRAGIMLLRYAPLLAQLLRSRQARASTGDQPAAQVQVDSLDEAYALLGLSPGASKEAIIQAHRKLIQKLHPDRGGNDYLAAKLNAAKELLLKQLP